MTLARTLRPLADRHPQAVLIAGSFDLQAGAVAATLDMATVNAQMDNVLTAHAAGAAGNNITITMVGDSPGGGGLTFVRVGTNYTFHFEAGVSTQGDFNNAVLAFAGGDDLFEVTAAGNVATILQNGRATLDFGSVFANANSNVRAGFLTGAAGNQYSVKAFNDGVGAGTLEVVTLVGGAKVLCYHFQNGVTTVADFEAALALLAPADFELMTAGTAGNFWVTGDRAATDTFATGTAVHAENAAASFAGGSDPVAPTSWRGMKECTGIAHPAAGRYVLSFRDSYPAVLALQATLQLTGAGGSSVQVGAFSAVNGTVEIRVVTTATGALIDVVPAAGDRINVTALVSNTRMGRISTL